MIKILFICHGNICRSPMAEFVLKDKVRKLGLENEFYIASCATSREEIGNDVHPGTKKKLKACGIPVERRGAVQLTKGDYEKYDYLLAMDTQNVRNIMRILNEDPENKVYKLLDFASSKGDIADPWYTGNFDETYEDVVEGCEGFLEYLRSHNQIR